MVRVSLSTEKLLLTELLSMFKLEFTDFEATGVNVGFHTDLWSDLKLEGKDLQLEGAYLHITLCSPFDAQFS